MTTATKHASPVKSVALYQLLIIESNQDRLKLLADGLQEEPCAVKIFTEGRKALGWAKQNQPEVILCSLELADISAIELLQALEEVCPTSSRVAISGNQPSNVFMQAVNEGRAQRFLDPNWTSDAMRNQVMEMACLSWLAQEKNALSQKLTSRIDELNGQFNRETQSLTNTIQQLNVFRARYELSVITTVKAMTRLMHQYSPALLEHGYRVAELSRYLAREMNVDPQQLRDIHLAGLLHDLGKLGMDKELITRPFSLLDAEQRHQLQKHAERGEYAICDIHELENVSRLVRHHHERYDGFGFPDSLHREIIPLGSRIIAVAEDFDEIQQGWLSENGMSEHEATRYIKDNAGMRYDPVVVAALPKALAKMKAAPKIGEVIRSGQTLREGATLTRDLIGQEGLLIQQQGKQVTRAMIVHIQQREIQAGRKMAIYVRA